MQSFLNRRNRRSQSGFTLIELLIVIAIILILIAIALPNFLEAQVRARVARVKGDIRSLTTAMESYFTQYNMYPPDHHHHPTLGANGLFYLTTPIVFIQSIPFDPFNVPGSGMETETAGYEMASTGRAALPQVESMVNGGKIHTFAVHSHGPSRKVAFGGNDGWPCGSLIGNPCDGMLGSLGQSSTEASIAPMHLPPAPPGIGWLDYSPTNGTSSVGEFVQVGGEHTSGRYCINGWRVIRGYYPRPCPGV